MKVTSLAIPDILLIEPKVFSDERGLFFESYNEAVFNQATGLNVTFIQDNHSRSTKGVLRGLHYQLSPRVQGKLVRVTVGEVLDIAVDIRPVSPTFGKWVSTKLSAVNNRQLWLPPGFAHGFVVLSDSADFLYKVTDIWSKPHDRSLRWDDPHLSIDWQIVDPIISEKDAKGLSWEAACAEFSQILADEQIA